MDRGVDAHPLGWGERGGFGGSIKGPRGHSLLSQVCTLLDLVDDKPREIQAERQDFADLLAEPVTLTVRQTDCEYLDTG